MKKIVTFGELLLRLAAPGYTRLFQKDCFDVTFCGAEANVAVSLALLGMDAVFVTKLPDSDVGRAATRALDAFRVDTSMIAYRDGRMGLYYLEKGASQRPSKVIYDRERSALAQAAANEFDWPHIMDGVDWFHWTGITPALSPSLAESCRTACEVARARGITVSCDLNYRAKLWTPAQAQATMDKLMPFVDICIANEEDAEKVLGLKPKNSCVDSGVLDTDSYVQTAKTIHKRYGCRIVATTLRKSLSASTNGWSAILYDAQTQTAFFSREYTIQLVDRMGGGDSFAAALIFASLSKMDCQEIIDFSAAASCLKQTLEGDFNRVSKDEIQNLVNTVGNGRVQR